ncbi:MAG: ComF family protein [bacterium]|nr:ComF family protein [bacterium]
MSIYRIISFFRRTCCIGCGETSLLNRYGFCEECEDKLIYISPSTESEIFHLFRYEGPLKEAIHKFKYKRKKHYGKKFALMLKDFIIDNKIYDFEIIIPVPLHWKKEFFRGFNQCAIIAFNLSKLLGKQYLSGVLVKCKNTPSQIALDKTDRQENVKGSFTVKRKHLIENKKILLIDDVYTSGATTQEAKKVLLNNGAEKVIILTIVKV